MKLFIGNLAQDASEDDLRKAAEAYGTVASVSIAVDDKGTPKGHGFVEMASKEEHKAALEGLDSTDIKGQALKVSEARPEKHRGGSKGGGGGFAGKGGQASRGPGKAGGSKGGFTMGKTTGHKV